LLWKVREYCLVRLPHLLPRIIDCVDFARPEEVAELHRLIDRWPLMPVENSLQVFVYFKKMFIIGDFHLTAFISLNVISGFK
jgi:hypothetical protein